MPPRQPIPPALVSARGSLAVIREATAALALLAESDPETVAALYRPLSRIAAALSGAVSELRTPTAEGPHSR